MSDTLRFALGLALVVSPAISTAPVQGQAAEQPLEAIASWVTLDVATGYETRVAPDLADAMPGWSADQWGNIVITVGSGSPRRIVACALDRPAYAASQITPDGYLRVHRIGRGSGHPLWDQAFEAQQVRVLTRTGPVAGVVGRSNGHFAAQHRNETEVVTADDLWVDVGAESAADVAALGIGLLDPIQRHLPPWVMVGRVAGPDAGRRAGCAAVATLADLAREGSSQGGETHFVLSANEGMGWVGLSSYVARGGAFDEVVILAPGGESQEVDDRAASSFNRLGAVLQSSGIESVRWIQPEVGDAGSHMEVLDSESALELLRSAASASHVELGDPPIWTRAPGRADLREDHVDGSLEGTAQLLRQLVELHGAAGHEWAVRRFVLESLPDWARERAVVDDFGNVVVEAGPERDTTVFMAHLDEVGYQVESIASDGTVTLARLGGPVSSAWEGQTALLHFDPADAPSTASGTGDDTDPRWKARSLSATAPEPLRGVFLSRSEPREKAPGQLRAWFGVDAAALERLGVGLGASVTSHKQGLRMGAYRFVARALDDRAGTSALLLAIRQIDPETLPSKVIFSWSVHEEGGLVGAAALARRFARTTRRIYSIDTFVSSDTPLESPHFAYAPLGSGPVYRAIENSGVSPDLERVRVFGAAEEAGIPLQLGLTQGGTDGTEFTFWGAPNQGLSWPGRYSHSPGEVLDLRDLANLARLIVTVAEQGRAAP